MKLLREIVGYLAYFVGVSVVSIGFAEVWHDFIVSYHAAMHETRHSQNPQKMQKNAAASFYLGCFK